MPPFHFTTERLSLRPTDKADAAFILALMNSPGWLTNIGDRGVHTEGDAARYIAERMLPQLERLGFGNFTVLRKADNQKLGTVGLFDRPGMEGLDIGFAFLPDFHGQGYAYEAAIEIHRAARDVFRLDKVSAITLPTNVPSQRLLEKLGLGFSHRFRFPDEEESLLFYQQVFAPARTITWPTRQNRDATTQLVDDILAIEAPLQIQLSAPLATPPLPTRDLSITMRTPGQDADLAVGFLWTEGLLSQASDLAGVITYDDTALVTLKSTGPLDLSQLERHFYTSSSCGVCGKASVDAIHTQCPWPKAPSDVPLDLELLKQLPDRLRKRQTVFEQTGGIHAAALFDLGGDLQALREDVGRHNALDKLIGHYVRQGELPLDRHILLLSGRASFELIQKAAMAGIRTVAAIGAPSSLAVELAEIFGIKLVGFLGRNRANVYT